MRHSSPEAWRPVGFSSADEAFREAVELLKRRETELQELQVFVQEGLGDLDAGDYEEFTDANLRELSMASRAAGGNAWPPGADLSSALP
jgi:hypothetical protein